MKAFHKKKGFGPLCIQKCIIPVQYIEFPWQIQSINHSYKQRQIPFPIFDFMINPWKIETVDVPLVVIKDTLELARRRADETPEPSHTRQLITDLENSTPLASHFLVETYFSLTECRFQQRIAAYLPNFRPANFLIREYCSLTNAGKASLLYQLQLTPAQAHQLLELRNLIGVSDF